MAVRMSVATASELPGTVIAALPLDNVVAAEAYVPLVRVTDPVGIVLPVGSLTVMVTVVDCAVVMLAGDGETVTAGVVSKLGADVPWFSKTVRL